MKTVINAVYERCSNKEGDTTVQISNANFKFSSGELKKYRQTIALLLDLLYPKKQPGTLCPSLQEMALNSTVDLASVIQLVAMASANEQVSVFFGTSPKSGLRVSRTQDS